MSDKSFLLFDDLKEPVVSLADEEAGKLFKAIFEYRNGGLKQDLTGATNMAFTFIKQQLDRSEENYEKMCERNRANGAKGGRPVSKTSNTPKPRKPSGLSRNPENPLGPSRTLPNPNPNPNPKSKPKTIYGEFKNVTLTDEEHKKCVDIYGGYAMREAIEKLSTYKAANGKTYKSDYAAINQWVWKSIEARKLPEVSIKKREVEVITEEERLEGERLLQEAGGIDKMLQGKLKNYRSE